MSGLFCVDTLTAAEIHSSQERSKLEILLLIAPGIAYDAL